MNKMLAHTFHSCIHLDCIHYVYFWTQNEVSDVSFLATRVKPIDLYHNTLTN